MIPPLKPVLGFREALAAFSPGHGDDVEKFEKAFENFTGQKHALAFPYGRTGLALLLEAMGLKDREVICPAYTCIMIPNAIVSSGNEPIFVDAEVKSFNMNLEGVSGAITDKTGALIVTSLFGYPVNLEALEAIRKNNPDLLVVQDCAHSFLAEWKGTLVHRVGDAALFSFNIGKTLHAISGGMITTDRDDLAQALRNLRSHKIRAASLGKAWRRRTYLAALYPAFWNYGLTHSLGRMGLLDRWREKSDGKAMGMPKDYLEMLSGVEARVGLVQLGSYGAVVEQRKRAADFYHRELRDMPGFEAVPLVEGATYSHCVATTDHRDDLLDYALSRGVQLGELFDYCLPETEVYRSRLGNREGYPFAHRHSRTVVNLPCGSSRRADEKVVKVIQEFFSRT